MPRQSRAEHSTPPRRPAADLSHGFPSGVRAVRGRTAAPINLRHVPHRTGAGARSHRRPRRPSTGVRRTIEAPKAARRGAGHLPPGSAAPALAAVRVRRDQRTAGFRWLGRTEYVLRKPVQREVGAREGEVGGLARRVGLAGSRAAEHGRGGRIARRIPPSVVARQQAGPGARASRSSRPPRPPAYYWATRGYLLHPLATTVHRSRNILFADFAV